MTDRQLYIAAYDVADPRRLKAGLEIVRGYATGGQKSAYECFLSEGEKGQLIYAMSLLLEEDEDRFLLLQLDLRSRVHTLGIGEAPTDTPYFYIG